MPVRRTRVLLVCTEKQEENWKEHIRILKNSGIETEPLSAAASREEVASRARQDNTVVVVDMSADPDRGMQTVSTCRRDAGQVPVVVVTNDSSVELSQRIRRSGVFYLAVPPVTPEEMLHILQDAFRYAKKRKASASMCKTKKKVLIIDDDKDFIATAKVPLEAEGYTVCSATSGKDGLEKVKVEHPDLIVLDIMMEHLSAGYEVNQAIKYKSSYRTVSNVPILMVSSITLDPATRFSQAGEMEMVTPDDYLTKPLDVPEFLAKVRDLVGE
jgi:CheY-like chemotaxis protein